jgi:hypothetical protein
MHWWRQGLFHLQPAAMSKAGGDACTFCRAFGDGRDASKKTGSTQASQSMSIDHCKIEPFD